MNRVLTITVNDLRVFFADRGNLISLLALPIVFTLVLGFVGSAGDSGPPRIRIDLLDEDSSPASLAFAGALRATNALFYLCPADDTPGTATDCRLESQSLVRDLAIERVRGGQSAGLVIIPVGYAAMLAEFEPVALEYFTLAGGTTGDIVRAGLDAVVRQSNGGMVAAQVALGLVDRLSEGMNPAPFAEEAARTGLAADVQVRMQQYLSAEPLRIELTQASIAETDISPTLQGFGQSVPGQGALFTMFTVLGALGLLVKERKQWTLQRLVVLPMQRGQILAGKILAYFSLGMLQYGVVFAVGLLVGTTFGRDPLAIVLVIATFVLCITSLAFALGTLVKSEEQANGISLLLSLTLAPLGGAWWPLEITPQFMQVIGHLSPVAWAMDAFHKLIFNGGTLVNILPELGVLLLFVLVFFAIGIRGFKYE